MGIDEPTEVDTSHENEKHAIVENLDCEVGNVKIRASGFFDIDDKITIDGQELGANVTEVRLIMKAQHLPRIIVQYCTEAKNGKVE